MTTIKFDKSVKYAGVRHPAHESFEVKDEDVAQLKEAGATVVSVTPDTPPQVSPQGQPDGNADGQETKSDEDVAQLKEELLSYSVPQLTKFAEEHNIDLQKKTRKADIYNIIVAAL